MVAAAAGSMDVKEVKLHLPMLHSLGRCKGNCERNILFSHLNDKSFDFVCRCLSKVINNPSLLPYKKAQLEKVRTALGRDKNRIKYLINPNRTNLEKKRKVVRQSGEGIGILLSALVPLLINVVSNALSKK